MTIDERITTLALSMAAGYAGEADERLEYWDGVFDTASRIESWALEAQETGDASPLLEGLEGALERVDLGQHEDEHLRGTRDVLRRTWESIQRELASGDTEQ